MRHQVLNFVSGGDDGFFGSTRSSERSPTEFKLKDVVNHLLSTLRFLHKSLASALCAKVRRYQIDISR